MVEGSGVEPESLDFQSSTPTVYVNLPYGVTDADRTRDIQGHNLMLYLLSYGHHIVLEATIGFEPMKCKFCRPPC